jgi:hypothetical protein
MGQNLCYKTCGMRDKCSFGGTFTDLILIYEKELKYKISLKPENDEKK